MEEKDEKKEKAQQKYAELQMIAAQMKQLQEQLEVLDNQSKDNLKIQANLEELQQVKEDTEIKAPIAPGIFIKAQIKEPGKVLVNVGGNTLVPKTTEDAKKLLETQLTDIRKVHKEITSHLGKLTQEAQAREGELLILMK